MKKGFTLAEVLMTKRTSGMENNILHSRESETKEPSSLNKKSVAFTLAEVLITLAVIGVVAALTIPTVVHKYQQKQMYTQFMKAYNTISNAFALASAKESPTGWDYTSSDMNDFYDKHFAPFIKSAGRGEIGDYLITDPIKSLKGDNLATFDEITDSEHSDAILLGDGTVLLISPGSDPSEGFEYVTFVFDTNGKKGPNTIGRDVFLIEVGYSTEDGVKKPYAGIKDFENNIDDFCNPSIDEEGQGITCAARLLKEGKMDY